MLVPWYKSGTTFNDSIGFDISVDDSDVDGDSSYSLDLKPKAPCGLKGLEFSITILPGAAHDAKGRNTKAPGKPLYMLWNSPQCSNSSNGSSPASTAAETTSPTTEEQSPTEEGVPETEVGLEDFGETGNASEPIDISEEYDLALTVDFEEEDSSPSLIQQKPKGDKRSKKSKRKGTKDGKDRNGGSKGRKDGKDRKGGSKKSKKGRPANKKTKSKYVDDDSEEDAAGQVEQCRNGFVVRLSIGEAGAAIKTRQTYEI